MKDYQHILLAVDFSEHGDYVAGKARSPQSTTFHPSRLASSPDEDLCLDDDGATDLRRRRASLIGVQNEAARRNRQAELREDRTGIRLMYFQVIPPLLLYNKGCYIDNIKQYFISSNTF